MDGFISAFAATLQIVVLLFAYLEAYLKIKKGVLTIRNDNETNSSIKSFILRCKLFFFLVSKLFFDSFFRMTKLSLQKALFIKTSSPFSFS